MVRLESIKAKSILFGLDPKEIATVVAATPIGDSLEVVYKLADGRIIERLVHRHEESQLSFPASGRPWDFTANAGDFKLAAEAYRINLAYLFDPMMAVHTSNVEPLPHQITAVYEAMLPKKPLRFVLADDPGAGKTIMAGLLVRELMMRADAYRILIVAPGSLVEQWQDELHDKFNLRFDILSAENFETAAGNVFDEKPLLIARLDQLARREDIREKLDQSSWDLIIFDEAHKLSANKFGGKINRTERYQLAEFLGARTRHLLLMTATPHNGKDEDFQLFMALLDSDRFYGKSKETSHQADPSDLMRRMTKEQLVKFDNTPLFPERKAYTVNYPLSDAGLKLYAEVTEYVKHQMDMADQLDDKRRRSVGFALTALQRRLASSPYAIRRSLERRTMRLKDRLAKAKVARRLEMLDDKISVPEYEEDSDNDREIEATEDQLLETVSTAETIAQLEAEILLLDDLVKKARVIEDSEEDTKWSKLRDLLQNEPEMRTAAGNRRKIIIFTEHKDTLDYLKRKIAAIWGASDAIIQIHGSVSRDERRKAQESFRNDPGVAVLLATDAAGEGVNLQNANLMVNYDLPWNPNRLEQRFGRIHRIGQTEVCHLWNLVASETREGEVFRRLLDKLQTARTRLEGRVFDVLGEVFEGTSLRDMLIEAIRYGERPETRAKLTRKMDTALDTKHIEEVMARHALSNDFISPERLFAVKEKMEQAEARRLQPYFIYAFFKEALSRLGCDLKAREEGRHEITRLPAAIIEADRMLAGRDHRYRMPVTPKYERVCFEKQHLRVPEKPQSPLASLIHAAHPLMQAVTHLMLEKHRPLLKQGAILIDPVDTGTEPRMLVLIEHAIKEHAQPDRDASRTTRFVSISPSGKTAFAGWAPHLSLVPPTPEELDLISPILKEPWLAEDHEQKILDYAVRTIAGEHLRETREQRQTLVNKTLDAVHHRLVDEINRLTELVNRYEDEMRAGKDARLNRDKYRAEVDKIEARLEARTRELKDSLHLNSESPRIVGCALVVPSGHLAALRGAPPTYFSADTASRTRIERIAMDTVRRFEEAKGHRVVDVSAEKCGWDLSAYPPVVDGVIPATRHIEVKGRAKGADTITVTKNEVIEALNQGDKYSLALVLVNEDGSVEEPHYIKKPFTQQPDWAVTSINLDLADLLTRATPEA